MSDIKETFARLESGRVGYCIVLAADFPMRFAKG